MVNISKSRLEMKSKSFLMSFFRALFLIGISFVILYPILQKVSLSFKSEIDMYDPLVNIIPKHFTLSNYSQMIEIYDYYKVLLNTILLCTGTALLSCISATMVGYGLAKFKFKLNGLIFACVLLTLVVPPQAIMMSQYLNMRFFNFFGLTKLFGWSGFNLTQSPVSMFLLSATCCNIKNCLFVFMMRQYFLGFPDELHEAASIDGANQVQIFVKIMLPAALTMMVTIFLFMFVWQWNDTHYSSMLTGNFETLSKKLSAGASDNRLGAYVETIVAGNTSIKRGMLLVTGQLLSIAPLLVLYVFTQRYLTEGIERSGLVG